ncbi:hypothetical protein pv_461 [Pithovirus sibericum]|uniref:Uncharacterized protein n=1 Tax=Pithovirus sibericum TaxID=1450746 RepID=W5S6R9_9VIRU|nr:hypothetical protein pv_461 [Pithovirus sibericum]AHH02027.1 hypothetical protein pv_461 [Pithovirus sibericum]WIL05117.1 hypothetical protein pmam_78 [Pithovirus mammoth]
MQAPTTYGITPLTGLPAPSAATPTPSRRRKPAVESVTAADFRKKLEELVGYSRDLKVLNDYVYQLPRGQKKQIPPSNQYPDGFQIGRPEVKSLYTQFHHRLLGLNDYFKSSTSRRRRTTGTRTGTFRRKLIVTDSIRGFFNEANLGPAFTRENGQIVQVADSLAEQMVLLRQNGLSFYETLTTLFVIYLRVNNLRNPGTGVFYHADDLMLKYFDTTFDLLTQLDLQNPRTKTTTVRGAAGPEEVTTVVPPFNPQAFLYTDVQRIVRFNRYFRPDAPKKPEGALILNEDQMRLLTDASLDDELNREADLAKSTNSVIGGREAEAEAQQIAEGTEQ